MTSADYQAASKRLNELSVEMQLEVIEPEIKRLENLSDRMNGFLPYGAWSRLKGCRILLERLLKQKNT